VAAEVVGAAAAGAVVAAAAGTVGADVGTAADWGAQALIRITTRSGKVYRHFLNMRYIILSITNTDEMYLLKKKGCPRLIEMLQ